MILHYTTAIQLNLDAQLTDNLTPCQNKSLHTHIFYQADARMQNCACGPLLSLNARDKVSSDASKLGLELSYLKLLAKVAVSENPFSPFELQEGRCSKDGGGG